MQLSPRARNVLLVDGNREFSLTIETEFRRAGAAVIPFAYGQAAIEHLAFCGVRYPVPDLLLVNRSLSEEPDGYAVVRAARALEPLAAVSVLIMGGSDEPEDFTLARAAGADGYLLQPPEKNAYAGLVEQVLQWRPENSWSAVGPAADGNSLAVRQAAVQCVAPTNNRMMTAPAAAFLETADQRSFGERFLEVLGLMRKDAEDRLDPFHLAITRTCRRHNLTESQLKRTGGSLQLIANRRAALVDLIIERWPDETLLEVMPISGTELKRLKAKARAKVGLKLDQAQS